MEEHLDQLYERRRRKQSLTTPNKACNTMGGKGGDIDDIVVKA